MNIDCCKRPTSDIHCRITQNSAGGMASSNYFQLLEFLKLINGTDVSHQYGIWWVSSIQRRGMQAKYRVPHHFLIQGAMLHFAPFFDTLRCQEYGRRFKERNTSKKKDRQERVPNCPRTGLVWVRRLWWRKNCMLYKWTGRIYKDRNRPA